MIQRYSVIIRPYADYKRPILPDSHMLIARID
jgi:hypothetical protein